MYLLGLSFLAGAMTVVAPCVLPILPVIIGGSVVNGKKSRPWLIILAFSLSILVFTLFLKAALIKFGLSERVLLQASSVILVLFGLVLLFPGIWQYIMHVTGIERATAKAQQSESGGIWGDIILGVVLGPILNSCSPTYSLLLATILPASYARGFVNILAYVLGLSILLGAIAYGGRSIVSKLKWAADPNGRFKKIIAILLIIVGVSIFMQWDKAAEIWIIENGLSLDATNLEIQLIDKIDVE